MHLADGWGVMGRDGEVVSGVVSDDWWWITYGSPSKDDGSGALGRRGGGDALAMARCVEMCVSSRVVDLSEWRLIRKGN